jgi:hypothetical protein
MLAHVLGDTGFSAILMGRFKTSIFSRIEPRKASSKHFSEDLMLAAAFFGL